jgi:uncharacterized protein DUF2510
MGEPLPPPGWYPDNAGAERYFDGTDWTPQWRPAPLPVLSLEERSERLDAAIIEVVQRGWRVEVRTPTQAVVGRGQHISGGMHAFHFVLTLLTLGVWLIFWILHAISRFEKRVTLTVDPLRQRLRVADQSDVNFSHPLGDGQQRRRNAFQQRRNEVVVSAIHEAAPPGGPAPARPCAR